MRIRTLFLTLLIATCISWTGQVRAQDRPTIPADTVEVVELRLLDGSRLVGTIESESATEIVVRTSGGAVVRIPVDQIESRRVVTGQMRGGQLMVRDPNGSRLFFASTGRAVGKGRGYFADYYVFFPFVAYGVTDFATLGGGVSLIPAAESQLLYLAPKLTLYERGNTAISAGVLAGTLTNDETWGGLLYGAGTFGSTDGAVTLGVGFAWGDGDVDDTPVLLVGGEVRVGKSVKLITENYIIPEVEDAVLLSGGIRFFGERLAADLAFFYLPAEDWDGWPFIPFVGFAYNFGH